MLVYKKMTRIIHSLKTLLNIDLVHFLLHGPRDKKAKIVFEVIKYSLLLYLVRSTLLTKQNDLQNGTQKLLNFQYRFF